MSALIGQLASSSFAERETAMKTLLRMPGLPIEQLSAASESDDPEVRWRSREILKQSAGQSSQAIYASLKVISLDAGEVPPEGAVSALLGVIPLCTKSHLQMAADEALAVIARPADVESFRKVLAGGNSPQRVAAAGALCR